MNANLHPSRDPYRTVSMQILEARTLLASSFAELSDDGTLTVRGNEAANHIIIGEEFNNLSGLLFIGIALGPDTLDQQYDHYPVADIRRIEVFAGDGDDVVDCVAPHLPFPSGLEPLVSFGIFIGGGDGNDRVTAGVRSDLIVLGVGNDWVWGGDGSDSISGGDGDDTINGGAQKDHLDGGIGNDRLNGNGGHDRLFGGPNADRLFGYDGNDVLDGGSSNDRLEGGGGADIMYGVGGNDRFFSAGDDTVDQLFGGKNDDSARVDAIDLVIDIESIP
jgi:Ca2+-binding RTX toxin-like protein